MEEGISNIINNYTFSWDIIVLFYKSVYYYKDILVGVAILFTE
jgi:hypothetical protein